MKHSHIYTDFDQSAIKSDFGRRTKCDENIYVNNDRGTRYSHGWIRAYLCVTASIF